MKTFSVSVMFEAESEEEAQRIIADELKEFAEKRAVTFSDVDEVEGI